MTGLRRDWDYVTIEDYRHDMGEATQRSLAVIEAMKYREETAAREASFLRLALWKALGAGGRVKVAAQELHHPPESEAELIFEFEEYDASHVIRRRAEPSP